VARSRHNTQAIFISFLLITPRHDHILPTIPSTTEIISPARFALYPTFPSPVPQSLAFLSSSILFALASIRSSIAGSARMALCVVFTLDEGRICFVIDLRGLVWLRVAVGRSGEYLDWHFTSSTSLPAPSFRSAVDHTSALCVRAACKIDTSVAARRGSG